jgi:hypothetical protein
LGRNNEIASACAALPAARIQNRNRQWSCFGKSHVPEAAYSGTHLKRAAFPWRAGRHPRDARATNKGVTTTGLHVWAAGVSNLGRVGLVWGFRARVAAS